MNLIMQIFLRLCLDLILLHVVTRTIHPERVSFWLLSLAFPQNSRNLHKQIFLAQGIAPPSFIIGVDDDETTPGMLL